MPIVIKYVFDFLDAQAARNRVGGGCSRMQSNVGAAGERRRHFARLEVERLRAAALDESSAQQRLSL